MPKRDKHPTARESPRGGREPRTAPIPKLGPPQWSFVLVDIGARWSFSKMKGRELARVLKRLGEFEKMTWAVIEAAGSHFVEVSKIINDARKRLSKIKLEDTDSFFSLRMNGKRRIWGIRKRHILYILWWDPNHEVYPSSKK